MCSGLGSPEGVQPDRARTVLHMGLDSDSGAAHGGALLAVPHQG